MSMLIQNVRIISPDLDIADGQILIEEGKITRVFGSEDKVESAQVLDGGGRMAMPGFIDIHSHGADRCDVCDDELESIRQIAKCKLQEGVTTWLPTTLTQPKEKLQSIVGTVAKYIDKPDYTRCPGLHIEGPFLNATRAGAQNPEFVREPDFEEIEALQAIAPVSIISMAPELEGAIDFIKRATGAGMTVSAAHTSASSAQLLSAKEAGLTHLTHFGNAMSPLHQREIGAVGVGLLDDELMMELICDTVHLCPEMLKLVFKCVSIDRLMMITDSIAASWIGEGEVLLGGLKVRVENGSARLKEGGALAGSALRYNDGLRNVAEITGLPLDQIVKATSWNQARSLGLAGFGKIEAGYHADMVLLNADFSVHQTLVGGVVK